MLRPPPTSTLSSSSAASDVYKRQELDPGPSDRRLPPLRHRRRARAAQPDLGTADGPDELLLPAAEAHLQGAHRRQGDQEVRHRPNPQPAHTGRFERYEDGQNRPDQPLRAHQPGRRPTRDPSPDQPTPDPDHREESAPNPARHPGITR